MRFFTVSDVESVEKQSNTIQIGNRTIEFNKPKYRRHKEQTSDGGNTSQLEENLKY